MPFASLAPLTHLFLLFRFALLPTSARRGGQAVPALDASAFQLSMGMSHDYGLAIANGSTEVRVGTAIFGPRQYKDTYKDKEAAAGSGAEKKADEGKSSEEEN
jgi:hypothetical protein